MFCQDIDRVGPDMVLGIKLCDPEIHQEIGALIKFPPDDQICYEFFFVVLGGVIWVFMTLRITCTWIFLSLSNV